MDKKMIAPHIDELNMALDDVSREKICIELERLLEYRVPLKEAKKTLINKYSSSGYIKVKDLSAGLNGIEIKGRIIDIDKKSVSVQGENKNIFSVKLNEEKLSQLEEAWSLKQKVVKPQESTTQKRPPTRPSDVSL